MRDSYGRNIYGQSVLLARRLIEAGTRVVVHLVGAGRQRHLGHARQQLHQAEERAAAAARPRRRRACSATWPSAACSSARWSRSWASSAARRRSTPTAPAAITGTSATACCWPAAASRAGYVHGASDRIGAVPSRNPVTPADIIATIYHCLGIPADLELRDRLNRPFTLVPWGNVVAELSCSGL